MTVTGDAIANVTIDAPATEAHFSPVNNPKAATPAPQLSVSDGSSVYLFRTKLVRQGDTKNGMVQLAFDNPNLGAVLHHCWYALHCIGAITYMQDSLPSCKGRYNVLVVMKSSGGRVHTCAWGWHGDRAVDSVLRYLAPSRTSQLELPGNPTGELLSSQSTQVQIARRVLHTGLELAVFWSCSSLVCSSWCPHWRHPWDHNLPPCSSQDQPVQLQHAQRSPR